jgi:phosphopantetheine adenylyltransferase
LFKDVDFSGLSKAIDTLGDASSNLDSDERKNAIVIVRQWESDVIERIRQYGYNLDSFINFFSKKYEFNPYYRESLSDEQQAQMAAMTGTNDLYQKYLDAMAEREKAANMEVTLVIDDIDASRTDRLLSERQHDLEVTKKNIAIKRAERKVILTYNNWVGELNKDSNIQQMIVKAKESKKNAMKMQEVCHDKAQLAKLNVMISSEKMRTALRELQDFVINF